MRLEAQTSSGRHLNPLHLEARALDQNGVVAPRARHRGVNGMRLVFLRLQRLEDPLNRLGLGFRRDQQRIRRIHDHHVLKADRGHDTLRRLDHGARGFLEEHRTHGGVAVLVALLQIGEGVP